jgi:hypothetical protein
VPGLRDDHATAGAVPCDAAGLCRPQLAMILFEKFGQRQPLDPGVSTLADQVGTER